MKKFKTILLAFPEYYLMILAFLSGYNPPFSVNGMAIVLMLLCVMQIVFKNRIAGLVIAGIFMLVTLYMFGALMAEFFEFNGITASALSLLIAGVSLCALNLLAAGVLIFKYTGSAKSLLPRTSHHQVTETL